MNPLTLGLDACFEVLFPQRCVICGRPAAASGSPGPTGRIRPPGLRPWDVMGLCDGCRRDLRPDPVLREPGAGDEDLLFAGGRASGESLVRLVGAMKYHGVRGAALHLGALVAAAVAAAGFDRTTTLVPVPLHPLRRRARGFNQAALLARVAAAERDIACGDVLTRRRATGQQAKLAADDPLRERNVGGAFVAPRAPAGAGPLVLVDDLITSGATVRAAAAALRSAGWRVAGAAGAGLAAGRDDPAAGS